MFNLFTIVIFIQHKPRIAVAILDLQWMKMTWSGWQMEKNISIIKTVPWKFSLWNPLIFR